MADARYFTKFKNEILPKMQEEFDYSNVMEVPRLVKVVINVGLGDAISDKKQLDTVINNVGLIAGQKPVATLAKKSISNFKLRDGMPIGCKVTLRKRMMYEFVDRLINLSLPRTRDFQGISAKGFDGRGNFTFGIKEHTIFPEIDTDNVDRLHGMDITFVTTANTDEEALSLLKHFGMPFEKSNKKN